MLDRLAEGISNLGTTFTEGLSDLGDRMISGITDGIKAIFVPSDDYLSEKVDTLTANFSFVSTIVETSDNISAIFAGDFDEPPYIEMDFSLAESEKYDYGGKAVALDMSWYERYKPSVDTILSVIIYVCFFWRLFVGLPNMINGQAATFYMPNFAPLQSNAKHALPPAGKGAIKK